MTTNYSVKTISFLCHSLTEEQITFLLPSKLWGVDFCLFSEVYNQKLAHAQCHYSLALALSLSLSTKRVIMYYLSLAAYYIFFNASKVLSFLCILFLASFYVYLITESITETRELAALVGKKKVIKNLVHLKIQVNNNYTLYILNQMNSTPTTLSSFRSCQSVCD